MGGNTMRPARLARRRPSLQPPKPPPTAQTAKARPEVQAGAEALVLDEIRKFVVGKFWIPSDVIYAHVRQLFEAPVLEQVVFDASAQFFKRFPSEFEVTTAASQLLIRYKPPAAKAPARAVKAPARAAKAPARAAAQVPAKAFPPASVAAEVRRPPRPLPAKRPTANNQKPAAPPPKPAGRKPARKTFNSIRRPPRPRATKGVAAPLNNGPANGLPPPRPPIHRYIKVGKNGTRREFELPDDFIPDLTQLEQTIAQSEDPIYSEEEADSPEDELFNSLLTEHMLNIKDETPSKFGQEAKVPEAMEGAVSSDEEGELKEEEMI